MEEKEFETTNTDDMSVLRVLLHRIKGISAVSSTTDYLVESDPNEE